MFSTLLYLFTTAAALALILLFLRKCGLQLQYLRLSAGKPLGEIKDFWQFDWKNPRERSLRWQAFLLFPMLYPLVLDDESEEHNCIKAQVKRTHIGIYMALIAFVLLGILAEK